MNGVGGPWLIVGRCLCWACYASWGKQLSTLCPPLHSVHIASLSLTRAWHLWGNWSLKAESFLFLLWYLQYFQNSTRWHRDHNPIYCISGYKLYWGFISWHRKTQLISPKLFYSRWSQVRLSHCHLRPQSYLLPLGQFFLFHLELFAHKCLHPWIQGGNT